MQISAIQNRINNSALSFGRRPKAHEEADFQKTMEAGFQVAGVKQRIAITHGSVFPATDRDSFIGSPYGKGASEYIKFLKLNGFTGNQLGPNGQLTGKEISPYNSSALNENPLFIDLAPLTTEKYGKILSRQTYENITEPIRLNNKSYALANQEEAKLTYNIAIKESYKNFRINLAKGQPESIELNREFGEFLQTKGKQTEEEGLYHVLSSMYQSENSDDWPNELDKNLMTELRDENYLAENRYEKLTKNFKRPIEEYQFGQFLATKQIKENKQFRQENGDFKYFSDLLIGCSEMDRWRYKEAFLTGYSIGSFERGDTPYQTWGIPVLNPRKLFKSEKELNIGGEFIKEKLGHALENCENVRIDHALGLIEPFVYKEDTVHLDEDGKQIKSQIHGNFMSFMTDEKGHKLDDYASYQQIISRIIIPTLKEHGLGKTDAVWENICCEPDLFKKIYYNEQHLPRLSQLDYDRGDNSGNENWHLIGSHDSVPVMNMLKTNQGERRYRDGWNTMYLAGYLNQDPARSKESKEFCEKISGIVNGVERTGDNLVKADRALINAKFAELFTKEKVQVSFADIFGINDTNIVYNVGGGTSKMFWRERMAPDFLDKYYKNLSSENPTALNIPEVLKIAVQAKIDMQVVGSENKDETRAKLHEEYKPLLEKLDYYANMLKEKED